MGTKLPPGAKSVMRPTIWGNPYPVKTYGRETSLKMFEEYARDKLRTMPDWLEALRGHDLACACSLDQPCHADVLLKLMAEHS
jgi:hypothetical protein